MAQQDPVWDAVRAELTAGRKTTHWIWWVFPQRAALGRFDRARHFGLSGPEEAGAHLAHPVLGPWLIEATSLMLAHAGRLPEATPRSVDTFKLQSCMTLFEAIPDAPAVFGQVLERLNSAERCPLSRAALSRDNAG